MRQALVMMPDVFNLHIRNQIRPKILDSFRRHRHETGIVQYVIHENLIQRRLGFGFQNADDFKGKPVKSQDIRPIVNVHRQHCSPTDDRIPFQLKQFFNRPAVLQETDPAHIQFF